MRALLFAISGLLLLNGCATQSQSFACGPAKSNYACQPLSQVDKAIDQRVAVSVSVPSTKKTVRRTARAFIKTFPEKSVFPDLTLPESAALPKRLPEVQLAVWVAPFVDKQSVFHRVQWLDVVVQEARWQAPHIAVEGSK